MLDFGKIGAVAETLETGVRDIDSRMEEITNRIHLTNRLLAALVLIAYDNSRTMTAPIANSNLLEVAFALVDGTDGKLTNDRVVER